MWWPFRGRGVVCTNAGDARPRDTGGGHIQHAPRSVADIAFGCRALPRSERYRPDYAREARGEGARLRGELVAAAPGVYTAPCYGV